MPSNNGNCIIIGGGHNGLVCAAYLARAGRKVTVLEAADQVGGAAVTREFAPGFRVPAGAHLLSLLDKRVRGDLDLAANGLVMAREDMASVALSEAGKHLTIAGGSVSGEGVSDADRAAMTEYHRCMKRFAGVLADLHGRIPPRVRTSDRSDLLGLARIGWKIRSLGKADMREFLRIAGINIYDVLEEYFENPLLKGALSLDGVLGTFLGPRSNNSVFCALHRYSGSDGTGIASGGMGAVTAALAAAASGLGAEIRTGSPVARILVEAGQVQGVELENGETVAAGCVVSNADPKSTFFKLLGARHLEAGFVRKIQNLRTRGNASKLHLALNGLPGFTGLDQNLCGERLLIAPDMDYVERAFNHAKYGEYSSRPAAEINIPSCHDDTLAPAGKHVLSAVVQYTPYELKAGWSGAREAFTQQVIDLLEQYAPGIRGQVLHAELLTPADLEREFRIEGGHWHHAELALDQFLMMRPVPGTARYRTPVDGLFLCGAGCHPGGGVMGSAGRNAARVVLDKGGRTPS